jgi:hypothetical protein
VITTGSPTDYIGFLLFDLFWILLMFYEMWIFQQNTIYFKDEGIQIPGYYRDHLLKWEELSDVVVREDFVTIFNVNEKYLQYQVMQDLSILEVAKMNAFCKEKVKKESSTVHRES